MPWWGIVGLALAGTCLVAVVVGRGIRLGETGGVVARQLVTGPVVFGHPELVEAARRCDRCGLDRASWSWWAPMFRARGDRSLGLACADCHTVPGGAEEADEEVEADAPTTGVDE